MYFIMFMLFVVNCGGLSGGGIIMPLSAAFFKLSVPYSISMSNWSIFISGLVRIIINFN